MSKIFLPCYVETNTTDPLVLGHYVKSKDGTPLFDVGILFAANIDGTPDAPLLSFNTQLQKVLDEGVVAKLQKKGLKVSLSILGNHQTAGFSTLSSIGVASFVQQVCAAVVKYNLDGIDFDDEYVDPSAQQSPSSFINILSGLRAALPTTLLTLYYIGPAMNYLSYDGENAGDFLNYAWNPYYGTYNAPTIPGMNNTELSAAAVNIAKQSEVEAVNSATKTVNDGYGVFMLYNLTTGDHSKYLTGISNVLCGQDTVYKP